MKNIYIVSKNADLSNYLFLLLKEIETEIPLALAIELDERVDLIIIDTETLIPDHLKRYTANIPIILFAYEIRPLLIRYTSHYDINGIISLSMEASDIHQTLKMAFEKEMFYSDAMISMLFSNKINEQVEKVSSLTERENEILILMMKDLTNEEIAIELNLSVRTVNAHKGNIMRKTGAKTTSGLIKMVMDYSPHFKNLS